MKFRVQMKDPDTLSDAIADAVDADMCGTEIGRRSSERRPQRQR